MLVSRWTSVVRIRVAPGRAGMAVAGVVGVGVALVVARPVARPAAWLVASASAPTLAGMLFVSFVRAKMTAATSDDDDELLTITCSLVLYPIPRHSD